MTDNGIGENDEYEKVTMYQCIWCGKLFKTDRLHKCKFSPKMRNCFSCRHCRGVDEITVRPFDNETRDVELICGIGKLSECAVPVREMAERHTFKVVGEEAMHLAPDGKEGRIYSAEEIYHMLLQKQGKVPKVFSFDRHDLWQGICDKTQLRDDWNGRIRNAIKACGDSAGMPQSIRKVVQELANRADLDWKQLLHDFLQFDQHDYTFLPPDRRYGGSDLYLPAFNVDEDDGSANDIWVCVDTSASISAEELATARTEILDAMRQARLKGKISFFDSNITEPEPFESEAELKKITPNGGGGTSFQIIFDYLQERMYPEMPKAILIFTDGFARWPEEQDAMEVPVLWMISSNGRDSAPWGCVVKL